MNPPKKRQNSITQYTIQEKTVVGNSTEEKQNYDLMNCIMLNLGDAEDTDGILRLLDTILSTDMGIERKQLILEEDFEIAMTKNLEREVSQMCNYSDGVERKGIEKGIEKGIAIGKADLLAALRALGVDEVTLQQAAAQTKKQSEEKILK